MSALKEFLSYLIWLPYSLCLFIWSLVKRS